MNVIELEKVSLSDMQLGMVVNTLTADDKYSLLNRDNLTQLIQMPLLETKTFSDFFLQF